MRKVALIIATALVAFACNNLKDNEFLIIGEVKDVENGTKVFVEVQDINGMVAKDTAIIENGKFELKGTIEEIDLGFVRIDNERSSLPIILEEGKINVLIVKDSVQNSKIGGTFNNDKFQTFNEESKVIAKKIIKYQKDNDAKYQAARAANDTAAITKMMARFKDFQEEMNVSSVKFIKENSNAYLSVVLLENFLMKEYLPVEEVKGYYEKLDKSLLTTTKAKNIKKNLDAVSGTSSNSKAQEFSAPSPEGKIITLKESLGKVTIIDFWASWCGPCRMENPNVVALYKEFHDQGLNIIGVSLDKDAGKWKDAIAKDGLTWAHVSNLKFWDEPIAKLYGVESIPATFILDAEGNIVAQNLRGDELKAKVKELLTSK